MNELLGIIQHQIGEGAGGFPSVDHLTAGSTYSRSTWAVVKDNVSWLTVNTVSKVICPVGSALLCLSI